MNKEDFKKIAYPETYADEKELHDIFTFMRKNDPVSWVEPNQYRPFWAITKHEDIIEIEKQNELFINDPRTTLMDIPTEDAIKEFTGGSHLLVRSLVHMDNPDHQLYRSLTQKWFAPPRTGLNLRPAAEAIHGRAANETQPCGSLHIRGTVGPPLITASPVTTNPWRS